MKIICTILIVFIAYGSVPSQSDAPIKVTVNNVELTYIERGKGEPIILLHGGQADYRAWQFAMEHLSKNYRVISYSRRYNYPNKNAIVGNNHSAYIEALDLAAFVDKLKLDRVHLVGTSMGAYTALIYAVKHPKKVLTLTVAEPNIHAWVADSPAFKDFFNNFWTPAAGRFRANDDRAAMRILVDGFGGLGTFERMPPAAQAIALQNAHFFRAATLSVDHSPNIDKEKVRRLMMPVLLINGERTAAMTREIVEEFARVKPTAERYIVKGAGHGSPREKAEEFTAAVADFLTRHSKKQAPTDISAHTTAFATVNGVKLHYLDWGGPGETLLFITGMGDTAHVFDSFAPGFIDRFRVLALTRRGFGESEKPDAGYDVATLTEDIRLFLDHMKIKKAHLIGHSAAGNELTSFAAEYPGRTLKLVYLDAAYARQEVLSIEDKDPIAPPPPAKTLSEMTARERTDEEFARHLFAYDPPYRKVRAPVLSFYAIFEKHWALKPDTLPEKQKAAEEFLAAHVRPYQRRNIERLRRELPAARIIELNGTHHYFFRDISKKEEVVKTVRDFLLN